MNCLCTTEIDIQECTTVDVKHLALCAGTNGYSVFLEKKDYIIEICTYIKFAFTA